MTLSRVRWRERQTLRHTDLTLEQAYLDGSRRRHALTLHRPGIVSGLALTVEAEGLHVGPGLAIDGCGRELLVTDAMLVPNAVLDERFPPISVVDVSLIWGRIPETASRGGRRECGSGREDRWTEVALLRLATTDAGRATTAAPDDLFDAGVSGCADEAARERPVSLGRIERTATETTVVPADGPVTGLVGETVVAASRRARLVVGGESGSDARRFAVAVGDVGPVDRLIVTGAGETRFEGPVTVAGTLEIDARPNGGAPVGAGGPCDPCRHLRPGAAAPSAAPFSGVTFEPAVATPAAAAPWRIYRTRIVAEGRADEHPLRIEIGHPGATGDPSRYRFVVGRQGDSGFTPALVVGADGTTTVPGRLTVEGQVIPSPVSPDPDDPRFTEEMLSRWLGGLASGAAGIERVWDTELQLAVPPDQRSRVGSRLSYALDVTNSGRTPITELRLYQTIFFADAAVDVPVLVSLPGVATLAADEKKPNVTIETRFAPQQEGEAAISVTVVGVGPAGNVASASARGTVQVQTILT